MAVMDSMLDLFIYNAFLFVAKNTGVVKPHIAVISSALPQDMLGDFHILNVDCLALCFLAPGLVAKGYYAWIGPSGTTCVMRLCVSVVLFTI